jgi:DNA-binding winged helix-turn-helix (wHTH) protein/tetratricopeptide (TPR) repeat protein
MAVASRGPAERVRFGEFELDLARTELRKAGAVVNLAPQPLLVLALLVSNAGELMPRETIRQKLWGEDVNVDFEHGLNTCIRQIRTALGDEARSWRFIETVHRRGYRFHIPGPRREMPYFPHWKRAAGLAVSTAVLGIAGYRMVYIPHTARVAEAHDLVVQGRDLSSRITADAQRNAITAFERAHTLDPKNAAAHAGIALAYLDMSFDLLNGAKNTRGRIQNEAQTALALDASLADSHLAAAELKDRFGHDSPGAEQEFRRALIVGPNSMESHGRFGEFLLRHGRFADSEAEIRKALALDPQSVRDNYRLACVKYYGRDYDAAIAQLRRTLQLDPRYAWARHVLGLALLAKRQYDKAIEELEKSQRGPNGNLGNAYAMAGRRAAALKVLDELKLRYEQGAGASEFARVYIGLGEYDTALEWLNTAFAKGAPLVMERIAPTFDPLRNDPRFQELLRKADLNQ